MRFGESTVVAAVLAVLVVVLALLTVRLSAVAQPVPTIVVVPTLMLMVLTLVLEIAPARASASDVSSGRPSAPQRAAASERAVLIFVLLLPLLTYALGLVAAVLVFTYVYVRRWVGSGRWRSLLAAGTLTVVVYGLAHIVLGERALRGWLWTQLGVLS